MKISVIITTYNSGKTIHRILRSIHAQEGLDELFSIELIIIDDCSTDGTTEMIKDLGLEYHSTGTNSGGPNKGRNMGLKMATGDFISIVDHDDEWHPNRIKTLLPHLQSPIIVTSGFNVVNRETGKQSKHICTGGALGGYVMYGPNVTFINKLRRSHSGQNTYLGSIMFPAELKHVLFEETFGMVDYDWLLRLFHRRSSLEVCQALYTRYVEGINLSLNERYRLNDHNYSLNFVQQYKDQYPEEVRMSVKKINGSIARYYYLVGNMPEARRYFLRSGLGFKTTLYLLTSFAGSGFVKRKFNVFG